MALVSSQWLAQWSGGLYAVISETPRTAVELGSGFETYTD